MRQNAQGPEVSKHEAREHIKWLAELAKNLPQQIVKILEGSLQS
jgi:hypothetical protein